MVRIFKIFENYILTKYKNAEEKFKNKDEDEDEDIIFKDLIGIDSKLYNYSVEKTKYDDLTLYFNEKDLEELMEVDDGILSFALQFKTYNDYYYEVDKEEASYYANDKGERLIKKLFKLLDIKKEVNPENISYLFNIINNNIDIYRITAEIEIEFTNAVKYNCNKALDDLPFYLSNNYNSNYRYEVGFDFDNVEEYIKKNKLKDINTIGDLFYQCDFSSFCYEILNNPWESDYDKNFDNIHKEFNDVISELIDTLKDDEIDQIDEDPNQLKLFKDFESIKKEEKYKYQYDFFKKLNIKNLNYAKYLGGKLYWWFTSYEFQKNYISIETNNKQKIQKYEHLKNEEIINPRIENEYGYLVASDNFNL